MTPPRADDCEALAGARQSAAMNRLSASKPIAIVSFLFPKEAIKRKERKVERRKARKEPASLRPLRSPLASFAFKFLLTQQLALKGSDCAGISQRAAARRARTPDRSGWRRAERIRCFRRRQSGRPDLCRRR